MTKRHAHIPNSEPPDGDQRRRPGDVPPGPPDDRTPIREPGREPRVKDPPPDERPNPKRY